MRLDVVIVNYQTATLVNECVASLKKFPSRLSETKIVVVDNGSDDGSLSAIRAAHPDVTLIDGKTNLGFGKANNLALRGSDADFALLLNSDTLVEDRLLDGLITHLLTDDCVGGVGARVVNVDDGLDQDYPAAFPTIRQMARRALRGPEFPAKGRTEPFEIERIHGACFLARMAALTAVGYFDEGFFIYDEDADLCIRMRRAGWKLLIVPKLQVRHYGGKSTGNAAQGNTKTPPTAASLQMRYHIRRSRYRLYRKYRSTGEVILLKLFTDAVLLLDSARWVSRWSAQAAPVIRANFRIIAMNPFSAKIYDGG